MSLRLAPEVVGWDASNTKGHGVLIELPHQTALKEMKFWTGFFCQHFLLFWCQVYNKFHMPKTLQFGFWLYYIFFILWVLIQLFHLLIVDPKGFVFVGSKFMQRIKHQWEQCCCYSSISVNCDGFVNLLNIFFHFFLDTHHICSWILLASLTISAIAASVRNFIFCILYLFKHLNVSDQHVLLWRFHTFAHTVHFIFLLFTDHDIFETILFDFHM